ncbi:glutathione S-transferase N-terminal domain-containing protein [Pseudomarimonas arenosa]|uniref:Glutathione S-transferase N-terminal domain-containing protein n=1 Tax=Pseudomarimonas arenosa TaxID=2774145 RepID=A0AAW3ZPG9_9GAMM|nr:glutathione S-transferase N-terminal domain-containing protein [Pseudomarimonas arenosa]MBD8528060.1 glutathione S-transferase N-terminal domain-containing protein [Pseudomarimonas arenosa]
MADLVLIGRQSSHYTRVARIFALELGLSPRFQPIYQLMSTDQTLFGDNPALKLPILMIDGQPLYGTLNICRQLAREAGAMNEIYWPELAGSLLQMNAHELVAHAMAAQVEVVAHEFVQQRPADEVSSKRRHSLLATLAWLDSRWPEITAGLPPCRLSFLETSLFCLLSHFPFRNPIDLVPYPRLNAFSERFDQRHSAAITAYCFDQPAAAG